MARIMFTWELGQGLGHVLHYRELIAQLVAAGDEVWFYARNPSRARLVYAPAEVHVETAPCGDTPVAARIRLPKSYPEILFNCGFHDAAAIKQRLDLWRDHLSRVSPDLLVADFSPTVLLANRLCGVPAVKAGMGFFMPPDLVPLPPYRYWLAHDMPALARTEQRVVSNMNAALRAFDGPPVDSIAESHRTRDDLLRTFAEFDPYRARGTADYLGTWPREGFGIEPVWPPGDGPRVFAYLRRADQSRAALLALLQLDARICLYAGGAPLGGFEDLSGRALHVSPEPVDFVRAAAQSDLIASHGSGNVIAHAALAGKPQIAFPYHLESYLNARRVEAVGCGLSVPRWAPGDIAAKCRAALTRRSVKTSAERFAARYAGGSSAERAVRMLEKINRVLGR